MRLILAAVAVLSFSACRSDDDAITDPPMFDLPFSFRDGFETTGNDVAALFPTDNSRWTTTQNVSPNGGDNELGLDAINFREGRQSLRILAQPADDVLSKMNIEKGGFFAPLGSTVTISADFYVSSTGSLRDLFLIDLECCSCWDPAVPDNQCPGVRLILRGEEGYPSIERGKILGETIGQTTLPFPRDEWVSVEWQMILQPDGSGENRLSVNGQSVIDEAGKNLPNAEEFRALFADNGTEFTLQEPHGYERLQIGATANASAGVVRMNVDDFSLVVE